MSGWIKMGTGLASHGKVKALRRALKADQLRVIGALWAVWCVFDEHSASGTLTGYTLDDMDDEIGWKGFSAAMRDIGWLLEEPDGLHAPDYENHNGPNAKRRALDASRKGISRNTGHKSASSPQNVRIDSGQMSASVPEQRREEKRREEEIHSEAIASGAVAPPPDTADTIFGLGIPLLTAASVTERNARSMLGLMRKTHGDGAVIDALQRCASEKPLQPVAWLQAALKAVNGSRRPRPDQVAEANIAIVRQFAERTS